MFYICIHIDAILFVGGLPKFERARVA